MNEKIKELVAEELHHENLTAIIGQCHQLFEQNPTLYGTLYLILETVKEEHFDDHGTISSEGLEKVTSALQNPLLALLNTGKDCPGPFLDKLQALWEGFYSLRRNL